MPQQKKQILSLTLELLDAHNERDCERRSKRNEQRYNDGIWGRYRNTLENFAG